MRFIGQLSLCNLNAKLSSLCDNPHQKKISQSRKRLGNPYAYLDGDGGFDAHSALWVTKNPYAAISSGARNKENISINRSISRVGKRDSNKKNYSHNESSSVGFNTSFS